MMTAVCSRIMLVVVARESASAREDHLIHHLFTEQVARTPDVAAIELEGPGISYRDLNERANRLAHALRRLGVGPDAVVGLYLERSPELFVALCAVLKAGGAYLPLDPDYPAERLAFMLADARPLVLLTQSSLCSSLPAVHGAAVLCLDDDAAALALAGEPTFDPPRGELGPEHLAYVIYTSGSTGKPKGVAMTHGPLLHLIEWQIVTPEVAYRTLQFASPSFDVCCQEVFSTWASGGTLVLVPPDVRRDPERLLHHLAAQRVQRAFLPPVALYQLAEAAAGATELPSTLREVIAAGEALRISPRLAAFFERLPGAVLRNQYGPSETHVVTELVLGGPPASWPALPSIGRPLPGVHCHLLDEQRLPVRRGEVGEIHVGGAQVARGYLGRPDLTAERFTDDPFAASEGAAGRMYRTGDLARWTEDGDLEFCGRADTQVKIRGYRVELGEIESVLERHPAVKQAVVTLREDTPGDKWLAAYLVAGAIDAGELRRHLRAQLPDYMVPAVFVRLERMPLLPSGKVDRRALPVPERVRQDGERSFVAPRTPAEEVLAGIWASVLGLDRVGALDGFLDLGGHSLLGTRLLSRVRSVFGVELPLGALFEYSTVAELAAHVERTRASGAAPAAPRIAARAPVRLSFAQQRLWFLDQLAPGLANYNIARAVRLDGPLDARVLERSLAEIVHRHEALRTTFSLVDGEPRQVLSVEPTFTLPVVDLGEVSETEWVAEARRLAAEEAVKPFDLARGPLFRASLLRKGERSHVLLTTVHHIVFDGWSESVFWNELTALYEAFSGGRPSPLAELPLQVADHAVWQREWLSEEALSGQITYWTERLRGAPPALDLPLDHPRPAVQSHRGARRSFAVPKELAASLAALARREKVTLFMLLLAAFQVLLQRYSGQDDIVIGAPIAGRTRVETERLIGFFVNTLVLRTDLGGAPTFSELCSRVRVVTLGAHAHQDVPFARLVEELAPARDLGRSPIVQVVLVLENAPPASLSLGEASGRPFDAESATSKFDLLLAIAETGEGLTCTFEYATDLFDAATIARMAGHFSTLLAGIAADPGRRLHELPLLTLEEQRQMESWNRTATPYRREDSIQAIFEDQVERTPDAVAVSCGDARLTYLELDHRAEQLARHLRSKGVGAEMPVGLLLRRSLDTAVAVLAVLKAGGAYLPLDPAWPPARLAWMLEDAGASVVVANAALPEGPWTGVEVVRLDLEASAIERQDTTRLGVPASGDSLAYVMYTSGSTGKPKGVSVIHRGVVRLVTETSYARFAPDEVFLQLAPTAFDASTFEIWGALLGGGRLVICPTEKPSVDELGSLLRREQVTTLWLTAGLFNAIIDERLAALASLRQLLVGGEALSVPHVQKALRDLPGVTLINGYGPTEGTTFSCCFTITGADGLSSIPIGRPIANTVAHVLDRHLSPVPVGVRGELCIGGDGLARGYLGRPELTAERFVLDPTGDGHGGRLYRTGDLVRRLPSGDIEFIGRMDSQVKIRGHRIEPGEIEGGLASHPSVRACAVIVREDAPGDKRLCAYVVPAGDGAAEAVLREHLSATLPDYMVPAAFVVLAALPLTPNGKVDRAALPRPEGPSEGETRYVAPRTPVEEVLAGIWADVLRLDRVSVLDDFFALGGHSLLGTRLIARLVPAFGVDLPLRALFEAPTVALLARRVEAARESERRPAVPPIVPTPRDVAPPLSFAQQRLWFLDQLDPGSDSYNIPRAVCLEGALDAPALERSLAEIVRRHEVLRTTFVMTPGGEPRQVIGAPSFALLVVDLGELPSSAREAEARRLAAEEAQRPFDLAKGPLFRASLVRLSEDRHVLLTTVHHSVSDGWSESVLGAELAALYEAFSAGRPSPLPELPIQYADYAVWQRAWLSGSVLEAQVAYWKEQLRGAPEALELPAARARPATQSHRGASQSMVLSAELSAALGALARREGVTLFMALLAAFQVLLHRYSGQSDIVVGSPIAGRTRAETEGLIGFFLNTLVLRCDLAFDPTFSDVLARVRNVTLGAYAHQDVPFEKLVEEIAPARDLSRTPLFQVFFNMLNLPSAWQDLGGISSEPWPVADEVAKFDLNLYVEPRDGELALHLVYATDLFDAPQTAAMLEHLAEILGSVVAEPRRPISGIPLSLPAACAVVGETVKGRAGPLFEVFPDEATGQSLAQRFEEQARRHAGKRAIRDGAGGVSYAELDAAAERVAAAIGESASRVALLFEPGPEMIAAMLGVLKTGAAYVPLDLGSPAARLADMLGDSGATALLTHAPCVARARSLAPPGFPVLDVGDLSMYSNSVRPAARPLVSPDATAYVLYTSGSTGRPKGVVQSHRNALCHIRNYVNRLHLDADDTLCLVASYAFDAAVMDIFGALLSGATLCPIDLKGGGLTHLAARLRDGGVTVYHSTPTVFRHLVGTLAPGEVLERVRLVVLGGEEAQARDVDACRRCFPPECLFINGLGPTESTLALQYFVDRDTVIERTTVPVGYPVEGVEVSLENPAGEQMAVWGVGQMVLRSAHLALGYWNRPDATRAAFSAEPDAQGRRRYRTGDLGRRLPGGAIEHLGRLDHQVKIRGQRIELGEIEARLLSCPGVAKAVVVVRDDASGERSLAGYVVAAEGSGPTLTALREHLQEVLPPAMVPAAFAVLDAFPLLPNGKVDRQALPSPSLLEDDKGFVAPRTPAEEMLAGVWGEVLRAPRVGAADDFFALGGHSLLATQVIVRIQKAFGVELPLRAVFEAPTVARLAERVLAARESGSRRAAPPILRGALDSAPPLSFAQQRLWLLDQLEPGGAHYNLPVAARVTGPLDMGALERSLGEIVRRHEALRTTFVATDGEPHQRIAVGASLVLPVIDLSAFPVARREEEARRLAEREVGRPFDLARGPLLRATLLRLDTDDHVLLLVMHHIVSDGWSLGVLTQELSALYASYSMGNPPQLPELPVQYGDVARWQRACLSGEVLEEQLACWKERLRGAPAALELPADRPRPAVESHRGATLSFLLPRPLSAALSALARREGATLFMTLLAAFQVLLHRYSGQDDLVVGSPIAGRSRVETERLIGLFVNTLVLRVDLGGSPTFRELLARVREVTLGAYAHQDVPFEKLVEAVAPPRDLSRSPLFQVMFMLQNMPAESMSLGSASLRPFAAPRSSSKFDLTLALQETEEGLAGAIEYATDLFDAATIERMAGHFQVLLESVAADPGRRVSDLELLTAAERRTLLVTWSRTEADPPQDACVQALFEARAAEAPGAPAVTCEGQTLTYAALNEQANRLAHHLIGLGAGPGALVGVALDRSVRMPVALLGILKSGAAYVPLDPTYPKERLAFMLQDAGLSLLVTEERILPALPAHGARVVLLDRDADAAALAERETSNPSARATGADRAYVIYTSGSTGRPKGVEIPHRALVHFLSAMRERPGLSATDRLLAVTSLSFDIAGLELFLPLSVGAEVEIAPHATTMDGAALRDLVERRAITVMQGTPSSWRLLLAAGWRGSAGFKALVGGEAVPRDLASELASRAGSAWNMYGPTETTIWSCVHPLDAGSGPVLIGRPIAHTRVFVLDRNRAPAPIGVPGELYIGGAGLAMGYLGRPELTAERFVADPFDPAGVERLYRTGDLCRWRPGGALEIFGRLDHQVKIRGFRIELGEIEAALSAHPRVADTVVIVREDATGERHLVAYLVSKDAALAPGAADLRSHLQTLLPEYMLPGVFVVLDALPLLPNGKIDRGALPPPEAGQRARAASAGHDPAAQGDASGGIVAPRDALEAQLLRIWEDLLPARPIGVNDSFFESGGHSLLAARLIARIEKELGRRLRLVTLFGAPTIAQLAAVLRREDAPHESSVAPDDPGDRPVVPLFFGDPAAPLWGVIDEPPGGAERGHGVVVCAPIGHEHVRCHWTLRQVGTRLARRGFHVLRFDFYGVGDSAGDLTTATVDRWIADVHSAAAELRAATGVTRLSLLGVRFGAALAMLAARELRPDSLVVWDPVVDGEAYLRSLRRLHEAAVLDDKRFWSGASRRPSPDSRRRANDRTPERAGPVPREAELLGQRFSGELLRSISSVTAERLRDLPETRLFCVRSEGDATEEGIFGALATRGGRFEQRRTDARTGWNDPRRVDELFLPGDATTVIPSCFEGVR